MNQVTTLGEKHFLNEEQAHFAALSGDYNPMHVDAIFARRTQFGQQVVHGINTLLWGLDQFFKAVDMPPPDSLKVRFVKPTLVGDTVRLVVADQHTSEKRLEITATGVTVAKISLVYSGNSSAKLLDASAATTAPSTTPRELALEDIEGLKGSLSLTAGALQVGSGFPSATRILGDKVVAALLATSRLVGMECPGMHSLFAGLSIDLDKTAGPAESLVWQVSSVEPRFRLIRIDVCGGGIKGRLETYLRMPPTRQLAMSEILPVINREEFSSQHALIVGGSRGLGEITAKIIAAGGGLPVVTYAVGHKEAMQLADEICAAGGRCKIMPYDVQQPTERQLAKLPIEPTCFYYFATSSISRRKSALYEPELMREFMSFYVDGFYTLCAELTERYEGQLVGFYPSTVLIDQPTREFTEYSLAKLAGEALCAQLSSSIPRLRIIIKRLPRTLTDQTATVPAVPTEPSLDVMLPIIREVQATMAAVGY